MRGRGLKRFNADAILRADIKVARHARAWVETAAAACGQDAVSVARHARAWVETVISK